MSENSESKQYHPAPIVAGVGAFFLLLWIGQPFWTIAGGTAWISFITWYAMRYKSEEW